MKITNHVNANREKYGGEIKVLLKNSHLYFEDFQLLKNSVGRSNRRGLVVINTNVIMPHNWMRTVDHYVKWGQEQTAWRRQYCHSSATTGCGTSRALWTGYALYCPENQHQWDHGSLPGDKVTIMRNPSWIWIILNHESKSNPVWFYGKDITFVPATANFNPCSLVTISNVVLQ